MLFWTGMAWLFHNMVAHPIAGLAWFVGMKSIGDRVHDASLPGADGGR